MQGLYAIYDRRAEAVVGSITQERTDNAAVRGFYDLCANKNTIVGKHPGDFELLAVAQLNEVGEVVPDRRVVVTGEAWQEMQAAQAGANA